MSTIVSPHGNLMKYMHLMKIDYHPIRGFHFKIIFFYNHSIQKIILYKITNKSKSILQTTSQRMSFKK